MPRPPRSDDPDGRPRWPIPMAVMMTREVSGGLVDRTVWKDCGRSQQLKESWYATDCTRRTGLGTREEEDGVKFAVPSRRLSSSLFGDYTALRRQRRPPELARRPVVYQYGIER
jgi:hypothetical protein